MKAKITRVTKQNGDHFYYVYGNDALIKANFFNPEAEPGSISSEDVALKGAKELAAKLESSSDFIPSEETVYETPINTEVNL